MISIQNKIKQITVQLSRAKVTKANRARLAAKVLKLIQLETELESAMDVKEIFRSIHEYEPERANSLVTEECFEAFKKSPDFLWHGWECIGEMENVWGVEVLTTQEMTKWSKENPDGYWLYPSVLEDVQWLYEYHNTSTGEVQYAPVRYKPLSSFAREWNREKLKKVYTEMCEQLKSIDQWALYKEVSPNTYAQAIELGISMTCDNEGYCLINGRRSNHGWYKIDFNLRNEIQKTTQEREEKAAKEKAFKTPILRKKYQPTIAEPTFRLDNKGFILCHEGEPWQKEQIIGKKDGGAIKVLPRYKKYEQTVLNLFS